MNITLPDGTIVTLVDWRDMGATVFIGTWSRQYARIEDACELVSLLILGR